jgi:hypothetical protein
MENFTLDEDGYSFGQTMENSFPSLVKKYSTFLEHSSVSRKYKNY